MNSQISLLSRPMTRETALSKASSRSNLSVGCLRQNAAEEKERIHYLLVDLVSSPDARVPWRVKPGGSLVV